MNVILVGGGRTLYFLAQTFLLKDHRVTILDRDPSECARLATHTSPLRSTEVRDGLKRDRGGNDSSPGPLSAAL